MPLWLDRAETVAWGPPSPGLIRPAVTQVRSRSATPRTPLFFLSLADQPRAATTSSCSNVADPDSGRMRHRVVGFAPIRDSRAAGRSLLPRFAGAGGSEGRRCPDSPVHAMEIVVWAVHHHVCVRLRLLLPSSPLPRLWIRWRWDSTEASGAIAAAGAPLRGGGAAAGAPRRGGTPQVSCSSPTTRRSAS